MGIDHPIDLCGVGLGPSNLSLAALAAPIRTSRELFLEAKTSFRWHPGLMLPEAELQVSYLKDLVTLVDPTNPYSFLSFLADRGRLYRFLIAHRDSNVSREEFSQYYSWAARRIASTRFGHRVVSVDHDGASFIVRSDSRRLIRSTHMVIGVGHVPFVPRCARGVLGGRVLHASDFRELADTLAHKAVVVVGGGQSGAEVVDHLLRPDGGLPERLTWVSRRHGFLPLDDSPFANEWFNPQSVRSFYEMAEPTRGTLLDQQRMASNGISEQLLARIYLRLYELDYLTPNRLDHSLRPSCELVDVARRHDRFEVTIEDRIAGRHETVLADVVVLATGYRHELPDFIRPLLGTDDVRRLGTDIDYSLRWSGSDLGRIYVQNGAEHTHGVADPNLSLTAWRSAVILNGVLGREVYRTDDSESVLWRTREHAGEERDLPIVPAAAALAATSSS